MRLIDADALPKYTGYVFSAAEVAKAVENAPTVDAVPLEDYKSMERTVNKLTKAIAEAEPIKHGHWTNERNPMMYQLIPYVWVCDQCGTAFYYKTPYCGECGAKMDEEEK